MSEPSATRKPTSTNRVFKSNLVFDAAEFNPDKEMLAECPIGDAQIEDKGTKLTLTVHESLRSIPTQFSITFYMRINFWVPLPIGQAIVRPLMGNSFPIRDVYGKKLGTIEFTPGATSTRDDKSTENKTTESGRKTKPVFPVGLVETPEMLFEDNIYTNTSLNLREAASEKAVPCMRSYVTQYGVKVPLLMYFSDQHRKLSANERVALVTKEEVQEALAHACLVVNPNDDVQLLVMVLQLLAYKIIYLRDQVIVKGTEDESGLNMKRADVWRHAMCPLGGRSTNKFDTADLFGDCEDIAMAMLTIFMELRSRYARLVPAVSLFCPFAVDCSLRQEDNPHICVALISWKTLVNDLLSKNDARFEDLIKFAKMNDNMLFPEKTPSIIILEPNDIAEFPMVPWEKEERSNLLIGYITQRAQVDVVSQNTIVYARPFMSHLDSYYEYFVSLWSPILIDLFGIGGLTIVDEETSKAGVTPQVLIEQTRRCKLSPKRSEKLSASWIENDLMTALFCMFPPLGVLSRTIADREIVSTKTMEKCKRQGEDIYLRKISFLQNEAYQASFVTMLVPTQALCDETDDEAKNGSSASVETMWTRVNLCWPELAPLALHMTKFDGISYLSATVTFAKDRPIRELGRSISIPTTTSVTAELDEDEE